MKFIFVLYQCLVSWVCLLDFYLIINCLLDRSVCVYSIAAVGGWKHIQSLSQNCCQIEFCFVVSL